MKDLLYGDLLKNIGMEIGNIIVASHTINMDSLELNRKEYPKTEKEIVHSSDCQIILWIKHLPDPRSNEEWVVMETIIQIGKSRNLINRFTDIRISDPGSTYEGEERRKNKPIRIL